MNYKFSVAMKVFRHLDSTQTIYEISVDLEWPMGGGEGVGYKISRSQVTDLLFRLCD